MFNVSTGSPLRGGLVRHHLQEKLADVQRKLADVSSIMHLFHGHYSASWQHRHFGEESTVDTVDLRSMADVADIDRTLHDVC